MWESSLSYIAHFIRNLLVKEFCKSVYICQRYDETPSVVSFQAHSAVPMECVVSCLSLSLCESVFLSVCLFECLWVCVCVCVGRYQKLWKQYIRLKHLAANKPKVLSKDREKLRLLEDQLQEIRLKGHVSLWSVDFVNLMKLTNCLSK